VVLFRHLCFRCLIARPNRVWVFVGQLVRLVGVVGVDAGVEEADAEEEVDAEEVEVDVEAVEEDADRELSTYAVLMKLYCTTSCLIQATVGDWSPLHQSLDSAHGGHRRMSLEVGWLMYRDVV